MESRKHESRLEDGAARDLAIVVEELEDFLDPDVVPDWLLTEQLTLGGRTPMQALRDGDLAEVLQLLNATEHGAYIRVAGFSLRVSPVR